MKLILPSVILQRIYVAPTPSAAAELAVPDKKELEFQLFSYERQMVQKIENRIHLLQKLHSWTAKTGN